MERPYVEGKVSPEMFWNDIQDVFSLSDEDLEKSKRSILVIKRNSETWDLLPDLKSQYCLAILSDCPEDKMNLIRKDVDLSIFQAAHFSCEEHLLKDMPEFFIHMENILGIKKDECLYVDDNEKNIKFATDLGFQVCHFQSVDDLKFALNI